MKRLLALGTTADRHKSDGRTTGGTGGEHLPAPGAHRVAATNGAV